MPLPLTSALLVNWNTKELASDCIASLFRFEKQAPLEVIVVDNSSRDGSVEHLQSRFPQAKLIANNGNAGFAKANNQAAASAVGKYVMLLNSDAYLTEEILPDCIAILERTPRAILACRLLNPDGSLQFSADDFPTLGSYFREVFGSRDGILAAKLARQAAVGIGTARFDWATGAFLMLERELYLELGGLGEGIFMYGEDMEFCHRAARAGVPCLYFGGRSVVHIGGGSAKHESLRAMLLTDAGRIATFALMHGKARASVLRAIFMLRSLSRAILYLPLSALPSHRRFGPKALNHFRGLLVLAGIRRASDFI